MEKAMARTWEDHGSSISSAPVSIYNLEKSLNLFNPLELQCAYFKK